MRRVASVDEIDFDGEPLDEAGSPYVYVQGLFVPDCPACEAGTCVQKVILVAEDSYITVHEPEDLN